jgi:DNA polymerase (family 10)
MGAKLEAKLLRGIAIVREGQARRPLGKALPLADDLLAAIRAFPGVARAETAGSLRRMRETVGDLDFLVAPRRPADAPSIMKAFAGLPDVTGITAQGDTKASVRLKQGLDADLRVIESTAFGAAWHYFKESEVFRALGLPLIPPELREDEGEIEAAAKGRLPRLVQAEDIRGDLHVHSTWSDGRATIGAMAEAARALGYEYLALCDHSQSLKVAGGLSVAELRKKHREIDALNRTFRGFRILKGAEVDILADGSLDYPDDILDELEIVVVSVHTLFGLDKAAQTKRVIAALRHPRVTLLAHPTGRMLGQRDPYPINLHEVIKAAAEHGKALELNAQPDRLDISGSALREAKAAGVMISIDSDAHDTKSLSYVPRFGAGVARRGWLESKDVLNALPLAKLLKKLANASPGA